MAQRYISVNEAAKKVGLTPSRVRVLLREGRIVGAFRLPGQRGQWAVPVDFTVTPARRGPRPSYLSEGGAPEK